MATLLVTDSRGKGLQKYLDNIEQDLFDVDPYPGENIKKLLTRAYRDFDPEYHGSIMIMGGICGLTVRDKITKITHIRSYDVDHASRKFRKSVVQGLAKIRNKFPKISVIILPTVGIDLTRYNRSPVEPVEQYTLDMTVMAINKVIIDLNDKGIRIPWISKKIHHCRGRGRWTHRYQYLKDGCHYNKEMKLFVAQEITKTLNPNFAERRV